MLIEDEIIYKKDINISKYLYKFNYYDDVINEILLPIESVLRRTPKVVMVQGVCLNNYFIDEIHSKYIFENSSYLISLWKKYFSLIFKFLKEDDNLKLNFSSYFFESCFIDKYYSKIKINLDNHKVLSKKDLNCLFNSKLYSDFNNFPCKEIKKDVYEKYTAIYNKGYVSSEILFFLLHNKKKFNRYEYIINGMIKNHILKNHVKDILSDFIYILMRLIRIMINLKKGIFDFFEGENENNILFYRIENYEINFDIVNQ